MSDEDAFIRALRERPDDETTRLVYTDWLDDRSDPRAEYLRAEAAWGALQPSDEQYRPLYRRASQLAAGLEPEWFATVSRMGHVARKAWERYGTPWGPHSEDPTIEPAREWIVARQEIENTLRASAPTLVKRFGVPVDYLAFVLTVGGGWQCENGWNELFSARKVGGRFAAEAWLLESPAPVPATAVPELWLEVVLLNEIDNVFLCCDLTCSYFGEVAEGENNHPWIESSAGPLHHRGETFLQFLATWSADD